MYGKLIISRSGKNLNQTFHGVPEETFRDAQIQMQASGAVNISWVGEDHRRQHYMADKVTGVAFERGCS